MDGRGVYILQNISSPQSGENAVRLSLHRDQISPASETPHALLSPFYLPSLTWNVMESLDPDPDPTDSPS